MIVCKADNPVMSLERLLSKAFGPLPANDGVLTVARPGILRTCGLDTLLCLGAK